MKIQPFLGTLSGRMGGLVFYKSKNGTQCARRLIEVANKNTNRQGEIRGFVTALSRVYSALIARAAWEQYALTHPIGGKVISALAMFLYFNIPLSDAGDAILLLPPSGSGGPEGGCVYVITHTTATAISLAVSGGIPLGSRLRVFQCEDAVSRTPSRRRAKLIGYSAMTPTSPIVMTLPAAMIDGLNYTLYFDWLESASGYITTDGSKSKVYVAP